jgi:hypothetical protein
MWNAFNSVATSNGRCPLLVMFLSEGNRTSTCGRKGHCEYLELQPKSSFQNGTTEYRRENLSNLLGISSNCTYHAYWRIRISIPHNLLLSYLAPWDKSTALLCGFCLPTTEIYSSWVLMQICCDTTYLCVDCKAGNISVAIWKERHTNMQKISEKYRQKKNIFCITVFALAFDLCALYYRIPCTPTLPHHWKDTCM